MRRVSMATRDELVAAIAARYARSGRAEKARILDEFVAVTGFHRKHAMRLLRGRATGQAVGTAAGAAALRRGGARGTDRALGGVGPDLRQAAEGADADPGRGDGAARPSRPRAGGAHGSAGDERGDDRPGSARGHASRRAARDAGARRVVGDPAQRSRCAPSPTGTIRRPASSRPIWSRTAGRRRAAASCRRWC